MSLTMKELAPYLGAQANLTTYTEDLVIPVIIHDGRLNRGHKEFEVEPVVGEGRAWVRGDRVELFDPEPITEEEMP